jgi:hypothetical protein
VLVVANVISSVVMTQLQRAIMRILGLPRDCAACVFIVVENGPDGNTHTRIGSVGLDERGIHLVMANALETVSAGAPDESRVVGAPGDLD